MAIYHLHMSCISRGAGSSTVATASYITGLRMHNDRTGETYDYGRKQRVVDYGVALCDGMPAEWSDPEKFTNAMEAAARQSNATVGRKIELALPAELSTEEQKALIQRYIDKELTPHGYGCIWAIHTDKDGRNPHAHILVADQPYADGKWQPKAVTAYAHDEQGERIPIIDTKTGKQKIGKRNRREWQRVREDHYLKRKSTLMHLRKEWAGYANQALEAAGSDARIDHRSYKDQGIDLVPTIHEGYAARRMASEGIVSERIQINEAIRELNETHEEEKELIRRKGLYERIREGFGAIRQQFSAAVLGIAEQSTVIIGRLSAGLRAIVEQGCRLSASCKHAIERRPSPMYPGDRADEQRSAERYGRQRGAGASGEYAEGGERSVEEELSESLFESVVSYQRDPGIVAGAVRGDHEAHGFVASSLWAGDGRGGSDGEHHRESLESRLERIRKQERQGSPSRREAARDEWDEH